MPAVLYYVAGDGTARSVKTGKVLKVNPVGNPRYCQVAMTADCSYAPKPRNEKLQIVQPEVVAAGRVRKYYY